MKLKKMSRRRIEPSESRSRYARGFNGKKFTHDTWMKLRARLTCE